jgi:hypothetical protein
MKALRVLLAAAWPAIASAQQCFHLDGSPVTQPDFVPCDRNPGVVSHCCALNRSPAANALPRPDVCAANGLCLATAIEPVTGNQRVLFIRESCTAQDWNGCLRNVCPRVSGVSPETSYVKGLAWSLTVRERPMPP